MKRKLIDAESIAQELFARYPALRCCESEFRDAFALMKRSFANGGKLLVAGNGGSAADAEHIVGELMKSFRFSRAVCPDVSECLASEFGREGDALAKKLEGALPALPLTSMPALTTAFANDVDAAVDFAQKLYGYGHRGDVFLGITTSGNSRNILYAMMTARAMGIGTVALTGKTGGQCKTLADISICVPETETFLIQEYHLPVYHALCAMLEAVFFEEVSK